MISGVDRKCQPKIDFIVELERKIIVLEGISNQTLLNDPHMTPIRIHQKEIFKLNVLLKIVHNQQ